MSTRYAKVRIGDLHLTADGTEAGQPCRVRVENESAFASPYAVAHAQSLSFDVHTQRVERGVKGIEFVVVVEQCPEARLDAIAELLNDTLGDGETVRVVAESLTDFDVQALPVMQGDQLFTFESRSGGIARNVRLGFISTGEGG